MNPKVCLITGANRGIGLEFVKQLLRLADPPKLIFAGCRNPDQAQELQKLSNDNAAVKVVKMDMNNLGCLEETRKQVESLCGSDGLNLLINNAGIFGVVKFEDTTEEQLRSYFQVNSIGPFITTQTFLPLIKKAAEAQPGDEMSVSKAAVINISSDSGSIGYGISNSFRTDGPHYAYRMSKAASNMFIANLSQDLKPHKVLAVNVHPGFVSTTMGMTALHDMNMADNIPDSFIAPEVSVSGILNTIGKLEAKDSGTYTDYEGKSWPW